MPVLTKQDLIGIFVSTYESKKQESPLVIKKKINSQLLPPCKRVLIQKIKRTNQIASIWCNATQLRPGFYNPELNGWVRINGKFQPFWFNGPQTPEKLNNLYFQTNLKKTICHLYKVMIVMIAIHNGIETN